MISQLKVIRIPYTESKTFDFKTDSYLLGFAHKNSLHGYMFWTGPETMTATEELVEAWHCDSQEKASSQLSLLVSLQTRAMEQLMIPRG